MVLGGQEEKKEEKGKGEGGRGEEEEVEGHVFLTFRMVKGRASDAPDRRSTWKVICAHHDQISLITLLQKGAFFSWKTAWFTKLGPSCWRVLIS